MSIIIYIPSISRSIKKEDIVNIFQDEYGIGVVEYIELLTETSNPFCDCCKRKPEHVEHISCDVCLLLNKRKQYEAYVQIKLNLENENAQGIFEAFGRNNAYNLRVTIYSDYTDRIIQTWCLIQSHIKLPLTSDKLRSDKLRSDISPPNTTTNTTNDETQYNVSHLESIHTDCEVETNCVSSCEGSVVYESNIALRRKLYEMNQLLYIRNKQIEELERQITMLQISVIK